MPDTDLFQGTVTATLKSIKDMQGYTRDEIKELRQNNKDDHERLFSKIEDTNVTVSNIDGQFKAHISDDNRRFATLWRVLFVAAGGLALVYGAVKAIAG